MNYGNTFHSIPIAVKEGCFFSILHFTDRNLLILQIEAGKEIKQIFIMSWPLGDRACRLFGATTKASCSAE